MKYRIIFIFVICFGFVYHSFAQVNTSKVKSTDTANVVKINPVVKNQQDTIKITTLSAENTDIIQKNLSEYIGKYPNCTFEEWAKQFGYKGKIDEILRVAGGYNTWEAIKKDYK